MPGEREFLNRFEYAECLALLRDGQQGELQFVIDATRADVITCCRDIATRNPQKMCSTDLDAICAHQRQLSTLEEILALVKTVRQDWPSSKVTDDFNDISGIFYETIHPPTTTGDQALDHTLLSYHEAIIEADRARLQSILQSIGDDAETIELTQAEKERLFFPFSCRKKYYARFGLEHLLQRTIFTPEGPKENEQGQTFAIKRPYALTKMPVHLRRNMDAPEHTTYYQVQISEENNDAYSFYVSVSDDLQHLWQLLFDTQTQNLLRNSREQHDHPLTHAREATMYLPAIRRTGIDRPIMHPDIQTIAPKGNRLPSGWLRRSMLAVEDLKRMKNVCDTAKKKLPG